MFDLYYNDAMNWDMIGHDWAIQLLSEHIAKGRTRHAYLFTGPHGIGKRTLALHFFQAINCLAPPAPGQFCRTCSSCTRIQQMQHADLDMLQAEQEGGVLKVDQIRSLQRSLSLTPYEAQTRMALLLRFEEANPSASNALLKTLEEPSPHVILVLTAVSPESLLPTIVSRCEVLRLSPAPLQAVSEYLQKHKGLSAEQAALLAHLSAGRVGYAFHLQDDPDRLEQRRACVDDLLQLMKSGRLRRFSFAESLYKDKDQARQVLQVWLSFWRDIMLRTAGASAPLTNRDRADEIEDLSGKLDTIDASETVKALERTIIHLENNVNARVALEVLLLDLPVISH